MGTGYPVERVEPSYCIRAASVPSYGVVVMIFPTVPAGLVLVLIGGRLRDCEKPIAPLPTSLVFGGGVLRPHESLQDGDDRFVQRVLPRELHM